MLISTCNWLLTRDTEVAFQVEGIAGFIMKSVGSGVVRILVSDTACPFPCAGYPQTLEHLYARAADPGALQISPVSSCPRLDEGGWDVLCQIGKPPPAGGEVLCTTASVDGLGAVAVQAEVSNFARRDFRYRRLCCGSLLLGLISVCSLLEGRFALELARQEQERGRRLESTSAHAQEMERVRLSFLLHDGVVQNMVAVTHMVDALREALAGSPEQMALIERSEGLLRQAVGEVRGVINALHSPVSDSVGSDMNR
ncbi:MAG: hypothetical protein HYX93_06975 [Chloroflexi bacterium]|nr:hypothetical protein [Chloroflexota bacterium]